MTIGSHQTTIGRSQVRITPRSILDPLGEFDLDPCGNDPRPWDCAKTTYTERDNGLVRPWFGRVWMNPPFHRYHIAEWIGRMVKHNCGILLVHVRTETDWFKPIWDFATALHFLRSRFIFHYPDGTLCKIENPESKHYGKTANSGAPIVLASFGMLDADVLADCGLDGAFVPLRLPRGVLVMALEGRTWRDVVAAFLKAQSGPVAVADVYRALRDHAKARGRSFAREQIRKVLQQGAGKRVARDQWVAA